MQQMLAAIGFRLLTVVNRRCPSLR